MAGEREPVLQVSSKVVSEERTHREGIVHDALRGMLGGCGGLRLQRSSQEDSVLPVEGLSHKRNTLGTTASEENGLDLNSLGIFPVRVEDWAILAGRAESRVGMSGGFGPAGWCPVLSGPVDEMTRDVVGHAFPPDSAIVGHGDVGEDGVLEDRLHRVRVRLERRSGCDAEKSEFC